MRLSGYERNGEWDIVEHGVTTGEEIYTLPENFELMAISTIGFQIKLRRRPMYFVLNVVVPRYETPTYFCAQGLSFGD